MQRAARPDLPKGRTDSASDNGPAKKIYKRSVGNFCYQPRESGRASSFLSEIAIPPPSLLQQ